jgi:hypothetical protein
VPTYDATQAFRRAFAKLDARTAAAFMAAVAMFVAELAARGFAPPFHPRLRVHKLAGLDLWAISFADGMRAVFRIAPPVVEGQCTSSGSSSATTTCRTGSAARSSGQPVVLAPG